MSPAPAGSALVDRRNRELTGPFWAAVDDHRLVRPVCLRCGLSFFTPRFACPACQSTEWRYVDSVGTGTVYSHTTVHRPPVPERAAPYVIAIVDVDEGWHMMTWIVGCATDHVHIGQRVRVVFVAGPDGLSVPSFAPSQPGSDREEGT